MTDMGYKKPNTDIRTPIFVSDNRNRIIEIAIRLGMKRIPDIKNLNLFQKKPESEKWLDNPDIWIKVNSTE